MNNKKLKGRVIVPGITHGTILVTDSTGKPPTRRHQKSLLSQKDEELRFEHVLKKLRVELMNSVKKLEDESLIEESKIIHTHLLYIEDVDFQNRVYSQISEVYQTAESAVVSALSDYIELLSKSRNTYSAQPLIDLKDLMGRFAAGFENDRRHLVTLLVHAVDNPIIATKELFPSTVITAREEGVKGLIVTEGTSLSHGAILAKSFGIPVIRIRSLQEIQEHHKQTVSIDAYRGYILLYSEEQLSFDHPHTPVIRYSKDTLFPAKIWVNILEEGQVGKEVETAVEGIGLYRTEILFMKQLTGFPDENTQYSAYLSLFENYPDKPFTIRTLDIGGDKTLPYFSFGPQDNPSLGLRAHRLYTYHPEILLTQFKAILRAGIVSSQLRLLYPMIEGLDELQLVQQILSEAVNSLDRDGVEYQCDYQQGILVEVPSSVWEFETLLSHVDFASIGSNDLLQYFFAIDRNNANVQHFFRPEHPAFLRMLKSLVTTARSQDKPLTICGEMASDYQYVPLLVGLGFKDLSVDSHSVINVLNLLSELDVPEVQRLAGELLAATSMKEVTPVMKSLKKYNESALLSSDFIGEEAIDPVCKMAVHAEGNDFTIEREGKKVYFCSYDCMNAFCLDEERF